MPKEQKILNNPHIVISSEPVLEDLVNGNSRSDITNFSHTSHVNKLNSSMFRDGSYDFMQFQKKIQYFCFIHSCNKREHWKPFNHVSNNKRTKNKTMLLTSIKYLREQVHIYTDGLAINKKSKSIQSRNSMFHNICQLCDLGHEFLLWVMPTCYTKT